jgi:transcriptional regulator with XRE-family HTH domain
MFLNIEIERLRRHLSITEMACRLSVHTNLLNDWIYRRQAIPACKLRALSQLFDGCSVDYLLAERR